MIRVICAILAIIIEDLEIHLDNSNLLLRKYVIYFKLLVLKKETSKKTVSTLYYRYQRSIL